MRQGGVEEGREEKGGRTEMKKKKKTKWKCRAAVMSERKNASHVGGKQWRNRGKRGQQRERQK